MTIHGIRSEEGKFNPSSRQVCSKCSTRVGLRYAFAYGHDIFLCNTHYREWCGAIERDKEIIREIPGRDRMGTADLEPGIQKQPKKVW